MRFRIVTVTPPNEVPLVVEVDQVKVHLNVDHAEHDALIGGYIRAAQEAVEQFTGHVLTERQLRWTAARFPGLPDPLRLWTVPVQSIDAVSHLGEDGVAVTLDSADWRWSEDDGDELWPAIGGDWPSIGCGLGNGAARVTFTAGYDEGLCPPALSQAVLLLVGNWYSNRDEAVIGTSTAELPAGVQFLCRPFRRVLI